MNDPSSPIFKCIHCGKLPAMIKQAKLFCMPCQDKMLEYDIAFYKKLENKKKDNDE